MRTYLATDLGIDMDRFISREVGQDWELIQGSGPFRMSDHAASFLGIDACPLCEGGPLRRKHYCLGCDRTGLDGKASFPGLGVDEAPDETWHASASVYDPDDQLAGGVGKSRLPKVRAGIRRRRQMA